MNAFFDILKPPGMTSAQVVGFMKRVTKEKRVGHAGTLDPEAAGVLPIMVGSAARLFDDLVDKEKCYIAECAFGSRTDTQDAQGQVLERGTNYPDMQTVQTAAKAFIGDIWQRPGMYSAIKKDGKPMYERARQGETVEVPERQVHIESIEVLEALPDHGYLMRVRCGRGTYIRSLCEDMGKYVGCPAHMRFLLRTQSGAFDLQHAMTLEEVEAAAQAGNLMEKSLPMDLPLQHLRAVEIPARMQKQARNGAAIPGASLPDLSFQEHETVRLYLAGSFMGLGRWQDQMIKWKVLLTQS